MQLIHAEEATLRLGKRGDALAQRPKNQRKAEAGVCAILIVLGDDVLSFAWHGVMRMPPNDKSSATRRTGRQRLQPRRPRRVRWSAWLGRVGLSLWANIRGRRFRRWMRR